MLKQPPQPVPFPKIQRLNEDVESNAQAALHMSTKSKQPFTPYAVQYTIGNGTGANDTKSVFSDTSSRRSLAHSLRSRALAAASVKDAQSKQDAESVNGDQKAAAENQEVGQAVGSQENGPVSLTPPEVVPEADEQAEKEELYDEINSLYNMENPKGDDPDERRSTYSQ